MCFLWTWTWRATLVGHVALQWTHEYCTDMCLLSIWLIKWILFLELWSQDKQCQKPLSSLLINSKILWSISRNSLILMLPMSVHVQCILGWAVDLTKLASILSSKYVFRFYMVHDIWIFVYNHKQDTATCYLHLWPSSDKSQDLKRTMATVLLTCWQNWHEYDMKHFHILSSPLTIFRSTSGSRRTMNHCLLNNCLMLEVPWCLTEWDLRALADLQTVPHCNTGHGYPWVSTCLLSTCSNIALLLPLTCAQSTHWNWPLGRTNTLDQMSSSPPNQGEIRHYLFLRSIKRFYWQ